MVILLCSSYRLYASLILRGIFVVSFFFFFFFFFLFACVAGQGQYFSLHALLHRAPARLAALRKAYQNVHHHLCFFLTTPVPRDLFFCGLRFWLLPRGSRRYRFARICPHHAATIFSVRFWLLVYHTACAHATFWFVSRFGAAAVLVGFCWFGFLLARLTALLTKPPYLHRAAPFLHSTVLRLLLGSGFLYASCAAFGFAVARLLHVFSAFSPPRSCHYRVYLFVGIYSRSRSRLDPATFLDVLLAFVWIGFFTYAHGYLVLLRRAPASSAGSAAFAIFTGSPRYGWGSRFACGWLLRRARCARCGSRLSP